MCLYALYVRGTHWERLSVHRLSTELERLLVGRGRIRGDVCFVVATFAPVHDDKKRGVLSPRCRRVVTKEGMVDHTAVLLFLCRTEQVTGVEHVIRDFKGFTLSP